MEARIHIPESTKEYLVQQGKGQWATPREDKIAAKGKGEMQSHWLNISGVFLGIAGSFHGPRFAK
jgi:hypothetical protein